MGAAELDDSPIKNAIPRSAKEIRTLLNGGCARVRQRSDLLLGFIHAAGLSVKQLW